MTTETRREKIVRFLQQSMAVTFAIWLAIIFNRRGELGAMASYDAAGFAVGQFIAAMPFGMMLTALGWGFKIVLGWFVRKP